MRLQGVSRQVEAVVRPHHQQYILVLQVRACESGKLRDVQHEGVDVLSDLMWYVTEACGTLEQDVSLTCYLLSIKVHAHAKDDLSVPKT